MTYASLLMYVCPVLAVIGVVAACGPGSGSSAGDRAKSPAVRSDVKADVTCHAWLVEGSPFSFHFALSNPASATAPLWVPRVLEPLGAFVAVQILDGAGAVVYETNPPKFTPKLDPESRDAYVALDPGYSHGTTFVDERVALAPGDYDVKLIYSNLYFRGPAEHPLGEQRCSTVVRYSKR